MLQGNENLEIMMSGNFLIPLLSRFNNFFSQQMLIQEDILLDPL